MRTVGTGASATAAIAVLLLLHDRPATAARCLAAPHACVADRGADGAVAELAAAALWAVAAWAAVGALVLLARMLPGALGTAADRIARVVVPRAVYRVAAGAAGLGVLLSPAAAGAGTPSPNPAATAPAPAPTAQPAHATARPPASAPAPAWPSDSPPAAPTWPLDPPTATPRPAPAAPGAPARHERASVTVRPGDSLWTIAAARLPTGSAPARIARAWPQWYAANRRAVGPDPNLLHPGVVLHAPDAASAPDPVSAPTSEEPS